MWLRLLGWARWVNALFMYVNLRAHKRVYIYSFRWVLAVAEAGIITGKEPWELLLQSLKSCLQNEPKDMLSPTLIYDLQYFLAFHKATHNFIYVQLYLAAANIYISTTFVTIELNVYGFTVPLRKEHSNSLK